MGIISDKINAKVTALKSEYALNKKINHQGVKGSLNELEINSLIKEVIPTKYQISKGIIENSSGEQSNETDFFIYDDEILPPYIKEDLRVLPVESVKYVFEVKSTLNATELKTTISKFKNFSSIGGSAATVLYSYSSKLNGSELERYKKNEDKFYTYPSITVLCISNKGYYFKNTETHYLKDYITIEEFINNCFSPKEKISDLAQNAFNELFKNNKALDQLSRSQFALLLESSITYKNMTKNLNDKKLKINEIDFSKITFKIHKWMGIESSENIIEMSLLSGISNTLCKENFGNYLLFNNKVEYKIFSICYEDMWGNISLEDFNKNGLDYNTENFTFTFTSNEENSKISFKRKE